MGRPKSKYIFFLVEGYTDKTILNGPISQLYEKDESTKVEFLTLQQDNQAGGDITSSYGITEDNIEGLIGKLFLDPYLEKNPYIYPKEISEIIQIVDLDGAFVPDDCIRQATTHIEKPYYYDEYIEAENVQSIIDRNQRKRNNLRKLISMDEIVIRPKNGRNTKKVKYSIYYFSCNIDHYIHGKANLTPQEKVDLADDFSIDYDDVEVFCDRMCNDNMACIGKTYHESWEDLIKEGKNSLKRGTNLNILIESLRNN